MELELAAPGIVQARMLLQNEAGAVLCCTLVMPASAVPSNMAVTRVFLAANAEAAGSA